MGVRIAVVDIGSNTSRLLVAEMDGRSIVPIEKARVRVALGAEIERTGGVSSTTIAAAAKAARKLCGLARRCGVDVLDVFLTAPGRQSSNADELAAALGDAAEHSVRVLSTQEEGRLAYAGAVATTDVRLNGTLVVCDVGGASTELAVGSSTGAPHWVRSVDLGSVRLATRATSLAHAHDEARVALAPLEPPRAQIGLAVGGTARTTARLVGRRLGHDELGEALHIVSSSSPREIERRFGVDRGRARILPAGVALLAQVQELLGVPLHVCSGGVREGALLASFPARAA